METFRPSTSFELAQKLRECHESAAAFPDLDNSGLNRLVEYSPEDMTATIESGMQFSQFQALLRAHKQWLPIDPVGEDLSIGGILDHNLSGSRRYGYGTIRDYLIGIKVALATGELIKAGGKVVKNVAGYDLCKLFIGAQSTLGIIVEATFKVLPIPESAAFLWFQSDRLPSIQARFESLLASNLRPVILDLFRDEAGGSHTLYVAFEGAREDVEFQASELVKVGFHKLDSPMQSVPHFVQAKPKSVLPSRCCEYLETLNGSYHAHLGNGVVFSHENVAAPAPDQSAALITRVKAAFDPRNVLPQLQS